MNVKEAIDSRRAFRSLEDVEITSEIIDELGKAAQLAPSCFNNQPWRYVFIYDTEQLKKMHGALSDGNKWATKASMIIAVIAGKEDDCVIRERDFYYAFDTGLATAHLILRATELGLVAHPIAGYSPSKTRDILGIPEDVAVITLVIVGKKADEISDLLSAEQAERELRRPERLRLDEIVFHNRYEARQ
ncbi:nitroreductase family protein [candidate division WOR-3 bacterium]|nr:nitroreductase family protein [candidate division WOR-3 bacterium]